MPANDKSRKTNWKAQEESTKNRTLLNAFTRTSEGNEGKFVGPRNIDDILKAMEANQKLRALATKKPYHPHLKGLFGGG